MSPDLSCSCGSHLFSATPVFQTIPDGRTFELASSDGSRKNVWVMSCLLCPERYVMGSRPQVEHGNTLLKLGSPEASELIERFTTDGEFKELEV